MHSSGVGKNGGNRGQAGLPAEEAAADEDDDEDDIKMDGGLPPVFFPRPTTLATCLLAYSIDAVGNLGR